MSKKTIIIILVSLLLVCTFYVIYVNKQNKNNYKGIDEFSSTPKNGEQIKKEIIKSKLAIYDIVSSQKPDAIREMMLDFVGYAMAEESLKSEIDIIKNKESIIKSMDGEALVNWVFSDYINLYGSKEDFKKDLESPITSLVVKSNTHIIIVLPNKISGNNIDMRTLEAFLVDGEWR